MPKGGKKNPCKMKEEKKYLLIIDVQQGFINEHTKHLPSMIEEIQKYYDFVFISKFYNAKNSFFHKLINWDKMEIGTKDFDLAFIPQKKAKIINKSIYSCVSKKFLKILKKKKIKKIYIVGLETEICVSKTAIDLIEAGITPVVLSKYCASCVGEKSHRFGVQTLKRYIGEKQVVSTRIERGK